MTVAWLSSEKCFTTRFHRGPKATCASWFERPRHIPWAQVPSNKPGRLMATKDNKKTNLNFRPRGLGSFSVGGTKKSNTVKRQIFHTSGVCLHEGKNFRTKIGQLFEFSEFTSLGCLWREKKPKKRNHVKEFGGWMPRRRPRDTWDIWAWFVCKSILKGQNVPGSDGTYHGTDHRRVPGTDGTHTRGCPAKILYVYWFLSFPNVACWSLEWRDPSGPLNTWCNHPWGGAGSACQQSFAKPPWGREQQAAGVGPPWSSLSSSVVGQPLQLPFSCDRIS